MISAVFNKAPQHIVRSCAGRGGLARSRERVESNFWVYILFNSAVITVRRYSDIGRKSLNTARH